MKAIAYIMWLIVWGVIGFVVGEVLGNVIMDVYKDTGETILASEIVYLKALPYILAACAVFMYVSISKEW